MSKLYMHDYPRQPKDIVVKILFDGRGKAKRVKLFVGSGYQNRDQLCIKYCMSLTHPPSKINHKSMGDSWRKLIIKKNMIFTNPSK